MDWSRKAVLGYPELLRQGAKVARQRGNAGDYELAVLLDRARMSLSNMLQRDLSKFVDMRKKSPYVFHAINIAVALIAGGKTDGRA